MGHQQMIRKSNVKCLIHNATTQSRFHNHLLHLPPIEIIYNPFNKNQFPSQIHLKFSYSITFSANKWPIMKNIQK